MNEIKYFDIGNNKRYNTYDFFLKNKFGSKVSKISLNGGFSCPNKDGTKSFGGCIFCSALGSGDFAGNATEPICVQFANVQKIMNAKWNTNKYIAYFQANTGTYADVSILREKYYEALSIDDVVGLSIATRADCLPLDVVELLEEISHKTFLTVELGLQSSNDKTAELIGRGHDFSEFKNGHNLLRSKNINTAIHIINGLPYETKEDMMKTVKDVAKLHPNQLKIHMLHIIKGTKLESMYEKDHFYMLSMEEYTDIVVEQLKILPSDVVIGRITGDAKKEDLIAPEWTLKKFVVMNRIDKLLKDSNCYQGMNYYE